MAAQDLLVDYLFMGICDAIDKWSIHHDVYGLWLEVTLFEDDPKRAFLGGVCFLRTGLTTPESADNYGGKWAAPIGDYCSLKLCEDDWTCEGDEYPEYPGDPTGKYLRDTFFQVRRQQGQGDELIWFLDSCGRVILRLHNEEILQRLWEKPLPVGVVIGNDVSHTLTLDVTRNSNPERISQGMEEWLMGRTYEEIAAEEKLIAEVRSWTVDRQAQFWRDAMWGQTLWINQIGTTLEWEQVRQVGISQPDWAGPATALLIELIVVDAEKSLSIEFPTPTDKKATEYLLMELFALENRSEVQMLVEEETVARLYGLLKRLYTDSQQYQRIGSALQLTARALHALRPERFPHVRFTGHRADPNRLLEPERFGLV